MYIFLCYLAIGIVFASVMCFMDTQLHDDWNSILEKYKHIKFTVKIITMTVAYLTIALLWPIGLASRLIEYREGRKF